MTRDKRRRTDSKVYILRLDAVERDNIQHCIATLDDTQGVRRTFATFEHLVAFLDRACQALVLPSNTDGGDSC